MFGPLVQAITSRHAGPAATALAAVLAVALAVTGLQAAHRQAALESRIAELTRETQRVGGYWKAKVAACEIAAARGLEDAGRPRNRATRVALGPEAAAARLVSEQPAGFDVCARMESADQAVLQTLK
jgi:hypothetical protein